MNFLRTASALSSVPRRQAPRAVRQSFGARPLSSTTAQRATQGYGDGKGDPKGENPQDQGASNGTKEKAEHPGPAPPSEGQGTGGGPTKAGSKSPEGASAQSGGARSKEAKETGSSPTGGEVGGKNDASSQSASEKSKNGNKPKIQSRSQPGGANDAEKEAEVKQHNKEFAEGHDRAGRAEPDKVDGKFWKGWF